MQKENLEIIKLKGDIFIGKIKTYMIIILLIAEIVLIGYFVLKFMGYEFNSLQDNKTKIAILDINEPITSELSEDIYKAIEQTKEDKSFKELIIKLNSPGGSPAASQEIAKYLQETQKSLPITMYIDEMAASGGYYIASSIKPIIANKNAIIGSIGVIMPHYNASELAKKVGIKEDTLTAGEFKQPFSFLTKMDEKRKAYIKENLLLPIYKNFLEDVAKNRGLTKDKLEPFAQGKVFIASKPEIKNILVDEISNFYKIKNKLKKKYGKKISFVTINQKMDPKGFFSISLEYVLDAIKSEFEAKLR